MVLSDAEGQGVAACRRQVVLRDAGRPGPHCPPGSRPAGAGGHAARRAWSCAPGSHPTERAGVVAPHRRFVGRPDQLERADQQDHRLVSAPRDQCLVKAAGVRHILGDIVELPLSGSRFRPRDRARPRSAGPPGRHTCRRRSARRCISAPLTSAGVAARACSTMLIMCAVRSADGSMHHRPADVAAPHRHQAVGLEQVDRLPQGGRADPELLEQTLLRGQHVALFEPAGQDVVPQPGRDDLGDPGLADRG